MEVNKDALHKVIKIIEEEATSPSSIYSYDSMLDEYHLRGDKDRVRNNGIMICCPFHGEKTPSLSIDYDRRTWYCYGCGKTGNVINFMVDYEICVLGHNTTVTAKVNQILKQDAKIRAKAGIDTVYKKKERIEGFTPMTYSKFRYRKPTIKKFTELASLMCEKKCTAEQKEYAILLMQSGLTVDMVYDAIFNDSSLGSSLGSSEKTKQYSMDDLWED